jgi:EAL domain-containing protein (putative c-di-GMP-specific phosphodiesterase class I)
MGGRVVLEITERASLDGVRDVRARVAALRAIGFRIAVDDLGAGYAGLTSFTLLEPDVVKLECLLHPTLLQRLSAARASQAPGATRLALVTRAGVVDDLGRHG